MHGKVKLHAPEFEGCVKKIETGGQGFIETDSISTERSSKSEAMSQFDVCLEQLLDLVADYSALVADDAQTMRQKAKAFEDFDKGAGSPFKGRGGHGGHDGGHGGGYGHGGGHGSGHGGGHGSGHGSGHGGGHGQEGFGGAPYSSGGGGYASAGGGGGAFGGGGHGGGFRSGGYAGGGGGSFGAGGGIGSR